MTTILQAGTLILALGLGATGALAQVDPGDQPPGGRGQLRGEPLRYSGGALHEGHTRGFMPQPAEAGVQNRWGRAPGYARPYGMRPQHFARYGETRATWSPRYRRGFVQGGYGSHRTFRHGYAPRQYSFGPRYQEYAPRFSYYRPRVRYAYAETPFAYDLPRETYATGIFPTASAVGLHSYDYAYTTQVRPIAAYGGLTGSYAGGDPIYNRPLAPAYPTPGCDCD